MEDSDNQSEVDKMMDLVLSKGSVYVWNAEDWLSLRQEHRIIGNLVGCLPRVPRQEVLLGLPLRLRPEEAHLLLDKKIARLVSQKTLHQEPTDTLVNKLKNYREKLFKEQNEYLKKERIKMIELQMDKIIEGKRRKLYGLDTSKKKLKKPLDKDTSEALKKIDIDRDELFAQEVDKIVDLEVADQIVQTHTAYPWSLPEEINRSDWNYPLTPEDEFKCNVFEDLWSRGFYVTGGEKFGGDFLAYPGDPIIFHSQFVVYCKKRDEEMSILDLVGQCRLSTTVRKTAVFACLSEDEEKINYQSFFWANSTANPF
ncbi:tRNA-splicing endonuclease subunit Sen34 [Fopius arisanus]|uniref:tRNA-splicing endonuclease subunit Sen34 n=2 Tax=Fopius arisanus TaxID=64838 RepID=A0A9R1TIL2_9HYME|nr:PREDICTED: tRNA-splicing endonuclease subunit Sen34 [Fopius arisanus]XP_011310053.1 PREDICTED: tRNA-splicing endonuclease subunit Sen34 [Fopius arisanus]XP_011310054.1 PREDICTED: tRNA-splicing endonuclease subunit Sen34 [Fopius arisanus]XP_011310055.1 PREDICTED: tRNA-splicing endonuclease subunit Sen34 [Fopius arisanus]